MPGREQAFASLASIRGVFEGFDSDMDAKLSFDEYIAARPGGIWNESIIASNDSWSPRCKVGAVVVPGIAGWTNAASKAVVLMDFANEWIACAIPPAPESTATVMLVLDFDGAYEANGNWKVLAVSRLPSSVGGRVPSAEDTTYGPFSLVSDGVLHLTRPEAYTGATLFIVVPQPPPPALLPSFFRASFRLFIHGGSGGNGISFSYGILEDGYISELGAGDGFRLLLRTADVEQAAVMYNGSTVALTALPTAQLRGSWRHLLIDHTPHGLTVSLDNSRLFAHVPIPYFQPTRAWRMAIGARCGAMVDSHQIDDIVINTGANLGVGYASVEIAANGRDFSQDGVLFEYYPSPTIWSVEPPCGPIQGGTVVILRGNGLSRPPYLANTSGRRLVGAGDVYRCGWGPCACTHHVSCACANVTIATWDAALDALRCISPPWRGSLANSSSSTPIGARLSVSLNGQDFSLTTHRFGRYFDSPQGAALLQLEPLSGPSLGGTTVRFYPPDGLPHGCSYVCLFGSIRVEASYGGDPKKVQSVACRSPAVDAHNVSENGVALQLALNGQQFVPLLLPELNESFSYFPPPRVLGISPVGGPVYGGTRVIVTSSWSFQSRPASKQLLCRFGLEIVPATVDTDTTLLCNSPRAPSALEAASRALEAEANATSSMARATLHEFGRWQVGDPTLGGNAFVARDAMLHHEYAADSGKQQPIEVSFNGLDFSSSSIDWTWLEQGRVLAVRPTAGPVKGGTHVIVRGKGLWNAPHLQCRFGETTVSATVSSTSGYVSAAPYRELEAHCISPRSNVNGRAALAISLNAQEFIEDGFHFSYYPSVRAQSPLRPLFGPTLGGTVVTVPGVFQDGAAYVCRIGGATGQLVPAQLAPKQSDHTNSSVVCAMPPVPNASDHQIELSLNGQQFFEEEAGWQQSFAYHSPMRTIGVAPASGPTDGGTEVLLRLENVSLTARQILSLLEPHFVCHFHDILIDAELSQPPPALGQQSSESEPFEPNAVHGNYTSHYDTVALNSTCAAGAISSTTMTLGGRSISCDESLQLLTLRCTMPSVLSIHPPMVRLPVTASVNDQDVASSLAHFHFYAPAHVSSVHPTTGPQSGGTLLHLRGVELHGKAEFLLCRFQPNRSSTVAMQRSLVALSHQRKPLLMGRSYLPFLNSPSVYDDLPVLTPATWDPASEALRCFSPPILSGLAPVRENVTVPVETFIVEVTANGQQYTSDSVLFTQYPEPVLSLFTPSGGPTAGGTALRLSGTGLRHGSEYSCRFGTDDIVPARLDYSTGVLHCTTPQYMDYGLSQQILFPSHLSVSLNGQQFSQPLTYDFAQRIIVSSVTPAGGPLTGGVLVHVLGANLRQGHRVPGSEVQALSCAFGTSIVPATFHSGNLSLSCTSPSRTPGEVVIEVTTNGQDFTNYSVPWMQYVPPQLSSVEPPSGPIRGGTLISVRGVNLEWQAKLISAKYVCGFGKLAGNDSLPSASAAATYFPADAVLRCHSPSASQSGAPFLHANSSAVLLRIALLEPPDQLWTPVNSALSFGYYQHAIITSISPRTGPVAGGTLVVVSGGPFARVVSGIALPVDASFIHSEGLGDLQRCQLGSSFEAAPKFVSGDTLECVTAPLQHSRYTGELKVGFLDAAARGETAGVGSGIVRLMGGASMKHDVAYLTLPMAGDWGGLVIQNRMHAPNAAAFEVSFEVVLYSPTGAVPGAIAGGVSFNFGPLGDASFLDEYGTALGLTLVMLPTDGLVLKWNAAEIARSESATNNGWTPITVSSNGTHVNVSMFGVLQMKDVPIDIRSALHTEDRDGFVDPRWLFGFGSRSSGAKSHMLAQLLIRGVDQVQELTVPIRESPNGAQFSEQSKMEFQYLLPPIISSISPSSGPSYGGTLVRLAGVNLQGGDDYRCRFKLSPVDLDDGNITIATASFDSAGGVISCVTPPMHGIRSSRLWVTLNGQQFSWTGANFIVFGHGLHGLPAWTDPPTLSIQPVLGPTAGSTVVQVHGVDFEGGTDFRCRFITTQTENLAVLRHEVPALVQDTATVRHKFHLHELAANVTLDTWLMPFGQPDVVTCVVPQHNISDFVIASSTQVEVTPNGQQFFTSENMLYRYHRPPLLQIASPFTGPTSGDTIVTISLRNGTMPRSGGNTLCRFGDSTVLASIMGSGGEQIRCTSPSELPHVANETTSDLFTFTGSARVAVPGWAGRASSLHLLSTYQPYGQVTDAGAAVLPASNLTGSPPPFAVAPWIDLSMLLRIRGNSSGSGLSISYSDLPVGTGSKRLGAWGVGGGLRISLFLTRKRLAGSPVVDIQTLRIRYDYKELVSPVLISPPLHGNQAKYFQARYDGDGLHIMIDGHVYLSGVAIPNWAPSPKWSVGFGAYSVCYSADFWGVDHYDVLQWSFFRGANVWPISTRLQVSLNGQQIDVDATSFTHYHAPRVTKAQPTSGSVSGGTQVALTGERLHGGDHYTCRFGAVVVQASLSDRNTVKCTAPVNCAGSLNLQISLNAQQYIPGVAFRYFGGAECTTTAGAPAPEASGDSDGLRTQVHSMSPSSGPLHGQSVVIVRGQAFGFGSQYVCAYNGTIVEASYVSEQEMACFSPASVGRGEVAVRVSLNAQQFFGNASAGFVYHGHPVIDGISPSSGAFVGGTLVNVSGSAFERGVHYTCAFGSQVVVASFVPKYGVVSCFSPPGLPGEAATVEVSLNAQQYSSGGIAFTYHHVAVVSSFSPSSGPSSGGTRVVVSGDGLEGGSDYRCQFDSCGPCWTAWSCHECVVNGTYIANEAGSLSLGSIVCVSPQLGGWHNATKAFVSLEVSLNSQQFTSSNESKLPYVYYEVANVVSVSPSLGPTDGLTLVVITGTALDGAGSHLQCRFGASVTPAEYDAIRHGIVCHAAVSGTAQSTSLPLQITLNGQQFAPSAVTYQYYVAPRVSSILPSAGPVDGGTIIEVHGSGLGGGVGATPDYQCRFYSVVVPAVIATATTGLHILRCTSPAQNASSMPLEVSLNAQEATSDNFLFRWVPPINLDLSSPGALPPSSPSAPPGGGGDGLAPSFLLPSRSPPSDSSEEGDGSATKVSAEAMRIAESVRDFGLSPLSGPHLGGTLLKLFTPGFQDGTAYRCRFSTSEGQAEAAAEYDQHVEVLSCKSPPLAIGTTTVAVSLNAQDFSTYPVPFTVFAHAVVDSIVPSSGPQYGNTTVIIEGSHFLIPSPPTAAIAAAIASHGLDARCKFGVGLFAHIAPATLMSDTVILCMSPPRATLVAESLLARTKDLAITFDSDMQATNSIKVSGSAVLVDGAIELTGSQAKLLGSFQVPLPQPELPVMYFFARFEALFGGDEIPSLVPNYDGGGQNVTSGGDGMHFFFGHAEQPTLITPVHEGLSLIVRTRVLDLDNTWPEHVMYMQAIELFYDGRLLLRKPTNSLRTNIFLELVLEVSDNGVRVSLDNWQIVDGLIIPTWQPQAYWTVGAAAETGAAAGDCHWLRALEASSQRVPSVAGVSLKVSVNAQQYSNEMHQFTYYGGVNIGNNTGPPHVSPVTLSALSPTSGPVAGATAVRIVGANLAGGDRYLCRFGHQTIPAIFSPSPGEELWQGPSGSEVHPAGTLSCTAPANNAIGRVALSVSPNAQQFTLSIDYTYHANPQMYSMCPSSGPTLGGTQVHITGNSLFELAADLVCHFNGTATQAALMPSTLTEYVGFTRQETSHHLPSLVRSIHAHPSGCVLFHPDDSLSHIIDDPRGMQRISKALAACENGDWCESVYYNDCDPSPHPLYLCGQLVSFEPTAAGSCAFRRLQTYRRVQGAHCKGDHYGRYPDVAAAVQACSQDANCGGVYDHQCDNSAADIFLCPKHVAYQYESVGSMSYLAPGRSASLRGSCVYLRPPWRGTISCSSPASVGRGEVAVRVSLNAQQFFGNASAGFVYHGHPVIDGISPSSGAFVGGTLVNVSGSAFERGVHYTCAFGSQVVVASFVPKYGVVSCFSPPGLPGEAATVEVSLNAQQYSSGGIAFTYHHVAVVSSFSPSSGPSSGGTRVVVSGDGLEGGSDYRCQFDSCGPCWTAWSCHECVVNGTYIANEAGSLSLGSIVCVSPQLGGWHNATKAFVSLEVSLNSQQFTSSNESKLPYVYYEVANVVSVSPSLGPTDGLTLVVITGTALDGAGSHLQCRFGASVTPAEYDAIRHGIVCHAAVSGTAQSTSLPLQITLNGQQFAPSAVTYQYYVAPRVSSILPSAGPVDGGTIIEVHGSGLGGGVGATPDYQCRFYSVVVPAVIATATTGLHILRCTSPAQNASSMPLEVSLNAQEATEQGLRFVSYSNPIVSEITPQRGPRGGGTQISIFGLHLNGADTRCGFTSLNGSSLLVPAIYSFHMDCLLCRVPEGARSRIAVSPDALHLFPSSTDFNYFDEPSLQELSPSSGPVLGGTQVTVTGANIPESANAFCHMGRSISLGTRIDSSHMRCLSPTLHASTYTALPELQTARMGSPLRSTNGSSALHWNTTGGQRITSSNLTAWSTALQLLGASEVKSGSLCLGAGGRHGSILLEPIDMPGTLPPLPFFEARFDVWAPVRQHSDALPTSNRQEAGLWPHLPVDPPMFDSEGQLYSQAESGQGTAYSVSFGDLRAALPTGAGGRAFGGSGAGRGLRVRFVLTSSHVASHILGPCNESRVGASCQRKLLHSDAIEVLYDSQLLARALVARNLSSNCWNEVIIRVDEAGIAIWHAKKRYLSGVMLPIWEPKSTWVFGLGAEFKDAGAQEFTESDVHTSGVHLDNWRISSAYARASMDIPLRLSFNGQQYTSALLFSYYRPPVLFEASPSSGPVAGATSIRLRGEALHSGTHRLCRFTGQQEVDANLSSAPCTGAGVVVACDYIECISPSSPISAGRLELSLNGQQFHGSDGIQYRFTALSSMYSLSPRGGPLVGGTLLTIVGNGLSGGSNYTCRFEGLKMPHRWPVVDLYPASGTVSEHVVALATHGGDSTSMHVICASPRVLPHDLGHLPTPAAQIVNVRISLNAQQYLLAAPNVTFKFYPQPHIQQLHPHSGPSQGNTVIMLAGTDLPTQPTADLVVHCRFGGHIVLAQNATCISPSDIVSGAGIERREDAIALFGVARRDNGVIRLTDSTPLMADHAIGYATFSPSTPSHSNPDALYRSLNAQFSLLIDEDGHGVSFSYGDIESDQSSHQSLSSLHRWQHFPSAGLGEWGGGSGLRVTFLGGAPRRIIVFFDGETLVNVTMPSRLSNASGEQWMDVQIRYRARVEAAMPGLRVLVDGVDCFAPLVILPWAPTARWTIGFGARIGATPSRHWVRSVHIRLGSQVQGTAVPVAISGNLQQWAEDVVYAYDGVAQISAVVPATGPTAGGTVLTVYGSRLYGSRHRCSFAASNRLDADSHAIDVVYEVTASYVSHDGSLRCVTPSVSILPEELTSHAPLHVHVSTNGQQYGPISEFFHYFNANAHAVHRLLPASGPTDGGTLLKIFVVGLNDTSAAAVRADGRAACLLNGTFVAASVAADGAHLHCETPPNENDGDVQLDITLNGRQVLRTLVDVLDTSVAYGGSTPTAFHYYKPPELISIEPLTGPHKRGYSVAIQIEPPVALAAASEVVCQFGGKSALGALLPPSTSLNTAAGGVVYAPRLLRAITEARAVPHIPDEQSLRGSEYDGAHLLDRFRARGLPAEQVAGVQYDADPIDLEGKSPLFGTDGHKYAYHEYVQHYRGLGHGSYEALARERWMAESTQLQWYFDGKGSCVGFGPPNDFCNASQLVCAGPGEEFGNYDQQAEQAVKAIMSAGNVHPNCPSLQYFEGDAAAWLHSGAGDWHHSTVVDRGMTSASTPVEAKAIWRAHLTSELASIINCTVPNSTTANGTWDTGPFDFTCSSEHTCKELLKTYGVRLSGVAAVHEGQLRLTHAGDPYLSQTAYGWANVLQATSRGADPVRPDTRHAAGAAEVMVPPGTHMLNIQVEFTLIIGNAAAGTSASTSARSGEEAWARGGEGVAVSYGIGLPLDAMGEFGGGLGLRVQFVTGSGRTLGFNSKQYRSMSADYHADAVRSAQVNVMYDGTTLSSTFIPNFRLGSPVSVLVWAGVSGVRVRYDGQVVLDFNWEQLIDWAPQPHWRIGLSAACSDEPENHWIDDLRVMTGTYVARTPIPVRVALNGQQYSPLATALGYAFDARHPSP